MDRNWISVSVGSFVNVCSEGAAAYVARLRSGRVVMLLDVCRIVHRDIKPGNLLLVEQGSRSLQLGTKALPTRGYPLNSAFALCYECYAFLCSSFVFSKLGLKRALVRGEKGAFPGSRESDICPVPMLLRKLADFNLACKFSKGHKLSSRCGSLMYLAPEVLRRAYTATWLRHAPVSPFPALLAKGWECVYSHPSKQFCGHHCAAFCKSLSWDRCFSAAEFNALETRRSFPAHTVGRAASPDSKMVNNFLRNICIGPVSQERCDIWGIGVTFQDSRVQQSEWSVEQVYVYCRLFTA